MATPELDIANVFLDCLRAYYTTEHDNLPDIPVGNFCLIPGTEIAEDVDPITGTDLCCDGLAWVRINDAYPSSNFPEPDPILAKCFPVALAQRYEVGILGCYPSPVGSLTCAQKEQAALEDAARLRALWNVFCCFGTTMNSNPRTKGKLWTVESISVQGPRGGCISRVASVLVSIPVCCE